MTRILYNYIYVSISTVTLRYTFYVSTTYLEHILKLESPKLIDSSSSLTNINHVVDNTFINKINSSNKFGKKYKDDIYSQDVLEIKKSKSQLNKKNRRGFNPLDIPRESIFIDTQDNFFDTQSLDISTSKIQKLNKSKKKDKTKIEFISNSSKISDYSQKQNFSNLHNTNKNVLLNVPLTIQELSHKLNIPAAEIITYLFLKKAISATINQVIDVSIAEEIASSYNFNVLRSEVNNKHDIEYLNDLSDDSIKVKRSPIITILGHVNHGKTTLLDSILKTNLVKKEYGGITQSISGYEIESLNNSHLYKLVFLDTPGHEAFESMRIRGIQVTDIVLLVVAADDGLQNQTIEAIKHIQKTDLPYIIVINKVDKKDVNIDRIQENLAFHGIVSEKLGGNAKVVEVSALTGQNIDGLLSKICQLSDIKNFTADPNQFGSGTILESYLDKTQGPVANVIVQNGTVKLGDIVVTSNTYGKIKNIINTRGIKIDTSTPSSIVRLLGFDLVPHVGTLFKVVSSEREAKNYIISCSKNETLNKTLKSLNSRITSDCNINIKHLNLIIKTDTQGSLEAILNLLSKLSQAKVQINIISANFGMISNTDIELAIATKCIIISFNLNKRSQINNLIKKHDINFRNFNVIYDLFDYIKNCMLDLIDPEYDKKFIGRAVVQTIFDMNKGSVAGCIVKEGKLKKMSHVHVLRKNKITYQGTLTSLKRIKEDVEEVLSNNECGVMCNYNLWQKNDIIESYELTLRPKTL
uniref:Translation initiation factor IF-2, chloroplastic n=1 Tax=Bostrychia tenella TaxID=324755 RepID=A0A1Z1M5A4_9FLOR|nr:translation initiation factor 2 [Bostrychia tenella]ARW61248.1 translation initiation factor 2 [Bostrychia tenella]